MVQKQSHQQVSDHEQKYREFYETIEKERPHVDKKPYSHNIISLTLQCAAAVGGNSMANRLIDDCDLVILGWSKCEEDDGC